MRRRAVLGAMAIALGLPVASRVIAQPRCEATPRDMEGPFYKAGAPRREATGKGLLVAGVVRTAGSCSPIGQARVEWWQANPRGNYDDAHRGHLLSGADGAYRFETDFPPPYSGRPSHVHVKVFAPGHRALTTQIYPKGGQTEVSFDLVVAKE
jgi:protocatechuate 3,4-dioxygenase beta subunit